MAAAPCSMAKLHVPGQPTPDEHHIIPRAWQAFMTPAGATVKGGVWDPRTVTVCPNHHRLVHEAIVAMMHAGSTDEPAQAFRAAFGSMRTTPVRQTAYLALQRWTEAGGSLQALRTAGLWGEQ